MRVRGYAEFMSDPETAQRLSAFAYELDARADAIEEPISARG
jgi:hypothetical protein